VVIALGTADELKSKVGKNRLELSFVKLDDLLKAEKLIDNKNISVDKVEFSISIQVENGAMDVKKVLDKLESSGIEIEGMSLHKPTLDDVFLNLTGHEVDKANLNIS
jgi:ABC-2 type transport system ATP-binding protein